MLVSVTVVMVVTMAVYCLRRRKRGYVHDRDHHAGQPYRLPPNITIETDRHHHHNHHRRRDGRDSRDDSPALLATVEDISNPR